MSAPAILLLAGFLDIECKHVLQSVCNPAEHNVTYLKSWMYVPITTVVPQVLSCNLCVQIDTPTDMPARDRFARYWGLKSWRSSPWDAREGLPQDYANTFAFENFKRAHKR